MFSSHNEAIAKLNTDLEWKYFKNISGTDTTFTDLPDYNELQLSVLYKTDTVRNMWQIRAPQKSLPVNLSDVYQCKVGHYATATENAMINIYLTQSKIKVAQAYVNGLDVHNSIVVGIYYR